MTQNIKIRKNDTLDSIVDQLIFINKLKLNALMRFHQILEYTVLPFENFVG
jgi:hypothetical protein